MATSSFTPSYAPSSIANSLYDDMPSQHPSSAPSSLIPYVPPLVHRNILHPSRAVQEQFLRERMYSPAVTSPIVSSRFSHLHLPARRTGSSESRGSVISRLDSVQPPWEPYLSCDKLKSAVTRDLQFNSLESTTKFLDHLFPPQKIPITINAALLDVLSKPVDSKPALWNPTKMQFNEMPKEWKERDVCAWLNDLGVAIGATCDPKREPNRLWSSGSCEVPLGGAPVRRKPDLILLDRNYHEVLKTSGSADWAFVIALAEVTSQEPEPPRMRATINDKSYLTFACQPHRRFTIALSFIRDTFKVTVTDRTGQLFVPGITLHGTKENSLVLLTVLTFLMFGTPADVGLDPFSKLNNKGELQWVTCGGHCYRVVQQVYFMQTLLGRGTRVYIVERDGKKYILKDYWPREGRCESEIRYIKKMQAHSQIEGSVPTLVWGGDVEIDGAKDCTRSYRGETFVGPLSLQRVHRRAITFPVGESITSFRSKKEFINAMRTIITTHRYLCYSVGVLHCDLSINNILLHRKDNTLEASGLLIDFDYSVDIYPQEFPTDNINEPDADIAANTSFVVGTPSISSKWIANNVIEHSGANAAVPDAVRTGTPPYMAIEALFPDPAFIHKPRHDLESILYIIFVVCTAVQRPGVLLPATPPSKICSWFSLDEVEDIGYRKVAHVVCSKRAILPYFSEYWDDFAPFVAELIAACFPENPSLPNKLDYDKSLDILNRAYDAVQEPSYIDENQQLFAHIEHGQGSNLKRRGSDSGSRPVKRRP